jgi:hypothetical protein
MRGLLEAMRLAESLCVVNDSAEFPLSLFDFGKTAIYSLAQ